MQINLNVGSSPDININGQISGDLPIASLGEGESITARVIFSAGGTAHLKTADGALIRARLDSGVVLAEGSEVTLTVAEKSGDTVLLRISETPNPVGEPQTAAPAARQPALPPALLEVFTQLQSSELPLAQKMEIFTKALADFPGLNAAEQAAVQEAIALLAARAAGTTAQPPAGQLQNGVGQLLANLAALLSPESAQQAGQQTGQQTVPGNQPPATNQAPPPSPAAGLPTESPRLPEGQPPPFDKGGESLPNTILTNQTTADTSAANQAVGRNARSNASPGAPPAANTAETPTESPRLPEGQPPPLNKGGEPLPNTILTNQTTANPAVERNVPGAPPAPASNTNAAPTANTAGAMPAEAPATSTLAAPPLTEAQRQELTAFARQIISELFTPGQREPGPQKIAKFIENLFAKLGGTVEQGGTELHKSARELELRLNFLKEAVQVSSLPQREEMLGQTARIIQNTEALREARLLCMQIPIQFEDKRQTAELYVYRRERKGGRKLDPQNATILLALNTEHLGRLEALIQTRGKEINLKLEIARAEAVPFVREQSNTLHRLLQEAGFKLNSASVAALKRETASPQEAERVLADYRRSFGGKLDFLI